MRQFNRLSFNIVIQWQGSIQTCGVLDTADLVGLIGGGATSGDVVFADCDGDGGENILRRHVALLHEGVLAVFDLKQSVSISNEFNILL